MDTCGWFGDWNRSTDATTEHMRHMHAASLASLESPQLMSASFVLEEQVLYFTYKMQSSGARHNILRLSYREHVSAATTFDIWFVKGDYGALWQDAKVRLPPVARNIIFTFDPSGATDVNATLDDIVVSRKESSPYAQVAVGQSHSCALQASGGLLRCYGDNTQGQLGQENSENIGDADGEMGSNLLPVDLGHGSAAMQVCAGSQHTCVLLDNGNIKCFGDGFFGQLGQGNTASVGASPGTMGDQLAPVDLGRAHSIACGHFHTCAVLDDGSAKCFGKGESGQLGQGSATNMGSASGQMGDLLPPIDLGTGRTAQHVSCGAEHTCILLDDDSLKCFGHNTQGQLGQENSENIGDADGEMGSNLLPVDLGHGSAAMQVCAGSQHTCVLLDNGNIKCFGDGFFGQLGQGNTASVGASPGTMGDQLAPVDLGHGRRAHSIACGHFHTCAVLDDGSAKCFGKGESGQLGQGSATNMGSASGQMGDLLPPIDLGTGRTAQHVSCGAEHTCILLDDDSLKCFGGGSAGQLGHGATANLGDDEGEMGDALLAIDVFTQPVATQTTLRLSGSTEFRGRVEVFVDGSWGTVCDDGWNDADAIVVCSQLGLAGGEAISRFGGGSGAIWMDNVACTGFETDLGQCDFRGWGVHDCSHLEDAGVECHHNAWTQLQVSGPAAREEHSAAWDSDSQSMLVFGGHASAFFQFFADLWIFDWVARSWTGVQSNGPSTRAGHSAVWDSSGQMILFGGVFGTTRYRETWLYQLQANSWSLGSGGPEGRSAHSAVMAARVGSMLIFGGQGADIRRDLWRYIPLSDLWIQVLPRTSVQPSARSRHTAVWDDATCAMLVFAGWAGSSPLGDLWHFSWWTQSWTNLADGPARAGHSAAWDAASMSMLIFGGMAPVEQSFVYSAELWNYSLLLDEWMAVLPRPPGPLGREDDAIAWDPAARAFLVMGGFDAAYSGELWRYKCAEAGAWHKCLGASFLQPLLGLAVGLQCGPAISRLGRCRCKPLQIIVYVFTS